MDKPFYRIGHGQKPDWFFDSMAEGMAKGDYIIKTKQHGIVKARDRTMTQDARKRREDMLCKLHG